jgi:bacterioferritin
MLGSVLQVAASYNTAFTKLAKMNAVRTLRECPERYVTSHSCSFFGLAIIRMYITIKEAGPMVVEHSIEPLNELLRGEHMAIHIYDKTKEMQEDSQVADMLSKFEQDHKRHAEQLTQRIKDLGGYPDAKTGISGVMADVMSIINSIRGPHQLLQQVYDGEDKGIHAYEERIDQLDSISQDIVRQIMKEDHEHLKWFKVRMEEEKREQH